MKRVLTLLLLFPLTVLSQTNLSGIWRLKETQVLQGPTYSNAVPILISINEKPGFIVFDAKFPMGEGDTVIKESVDYGIRPEMTKTGKKKIVSFRKQHDSAWLKQTEIFTKDDTSKLQSLNKEKYLLSANGNVMTIEKEYDAVNDIGANEDFIVNGTYERLEKGHPESSLSGKKTAFAEGLSWKQIINKARREKKMIFVDCYATWCGPCKIMDKNVYPLEKVQEALNEGFISVKVQMDSVKNDDDNVKMNYALARDFEKKYRITALPTFLFFNAEGKIIHKAIGQLESDGFVKMLSSVTDQNNQLYTLVNKARRGSLSQDETIKLIRRLKKEFREKELAQDVAKAYYNSHLSRIKRRSEVTKEMLEFVTASPEVVHINDVFFRMSYEQPKLVDSILGIEDGGWAEFIVEQTIKRSHINPVLLAAAQKQHEPDWTRLQQQLTAKYDATLAEKYVLAEKVALYWRLEKWDSLFAYMKPHLMGINWARINPIYLNDCAYQVFKHSNDTVLMKDALGWVEFAHGKMDTDAEVQCITLDTKACLLFKFGRRVEALAIMNRIVSMFTDNKDLREFFTQRMEGMKRGEKVWLTFN